MMEEFEQNFAGNIPDRKPPREHRPSRDKLVNRAKATLQGLDSTLVKIEASSTGSTAATSTVPAMAHLEPDRQGPRPKTRS